MDDSDMEVDHKVAPVPSSPAPAPLAISARCSELIKTVLPDGLEGGRELPQHVINDLCSLLDERKNDYLFIIIPQPGKGYGKVQCLEPACLAKKKVIALNEAEDVADGGMECGIGSLNYFFHHQRESPAHTKGRIARLKREKQLAAAAARARAPASSASSSASNASKSKDVKPSPVRLATFREPSAKASKQIIEIGSDDDDDEIVQIGSRPKARRSTAMDLDDPDEIAYRPLLKRDNKGKPRVPLQPTTSNSSIEGNKKPNTVNAGSTIRDLPVNRADGSRISLRDVMMADEDSDAEPLPKRQRSDSVLSNGSDEGLMELPTNFRAAPSDKYKRVLDRAKASVDAKKENIPSYSTSQLPYDKALPAGFISGASTTNAKPASAVPSRFDAFRGPPASSSSPAAGKAGAFDDSGFSSGGLDTSSAATASVKIAHDPQLGSSPFVSATARPASALPSRLDPYRASTSRNREQQPVVDFGYASNIRSSLDQQAAAEIDAQIQASFEDETAVTVEEAFANDIQGVSAIEIQSQQVGEELKTWIEEVCIPAIQQRYRTWQHLEPILAYYHEQMLRFGHSYYSDESTDAELYRLSKRHIFMADGRLVTWQSRSCHDVLSGVTSLAYFGAQYRVGLYTLLLAGHAALNPHAALRISSAISHARTDRLRYQDIALTPQDPTHRVIVYAHLSPEKGAVIGMTVNNTNRLAGYRNVEKCTKKVRLAQEDAPFDDWTHGTVHLADTGIPPLALFAIESAHIFLCDNVKHGLNARYIDCSTWYTRILLHTDVERLWDAALEWLNEDPSRYIAPPTSDPRPIIEIKEKAQITKKIAEMTLYNILMGDIWRTTGKALFGKKPLQAHHYASGQIPFYFRPKDIRDDIIATRALRSQARPKYVKGSAVAAGAALPANFTAIGTSDAWKQVRALCKK